MMANEHAVSTMTEKNRLSQVQPNIELIKAMDNIETAKI